MKFLRRLIIFIIAAVLVVLCIRHYKPQIASFLNDKGISVPGITDNSQVFPTSETITDENGQVKVVVSIPPTYASGMSDNQINDLVNGSEGRLTATRLSDGTITITVTDEYRDEILGQMGTYYDDIVISQLIEGKVIDITHNSDYSAFCVTCTPDMSETEILTVTGKLFAIGRLYGSFAGIENESIRVDVTDSQTGFITNSYTSDDMTAGLVSDARNWAVDTFDDVVTRVADTMENAA